MSCPWSLLLVTMRKAGDMHGTGAGSSQGAAQEMCEIHRGTWRKLSRNRVVAFVALSTQ